MTARSLGGPLGTCLVYVCVRVTFPDLVKVRITALSGSSWLNVQ